VLRKAYHLSRKSTGDLSLDQRLAYSQQRVADMALNRRRKQEERNNKKVMFAGSAFFRVCLSLLSNQPCLAPDLEEDDFDEDEGGEGTASLLPFVLSQKYSTFGEVRFAEQKQIVDSRSNIRQA